MSITSLGFLLFLTAALVVYFLVPKKVRPYMLLVSSAVFLVSYGWYSLFFVVVAAVVTYSCGRWIEYEDKKGATGPTRKKLSVGVGIVLLLLLLVTLKYLNTAISWVPWLPTSFSQAIPFGENLILPLAISYYILMAISYLMDVYWGKIPRERNFLKLLLFLMFFPQMLQGPISRYGQLGPQLSEGHAFNAHNLKHGVQLMLWGYFKVLVIAQRAGECVSDIFFAGEPAFGATVFLGLVLYGVELYCSFGGGIDVVRGVARCFGIDLMQNFRQPFFSTSLADFWRRWHISLGQWMKDYVFYPFVLSSPCKAAKAKLKNKLSRKTRENIFIALGDLVVFFFVGLWHGSSSIFIAWGLYNGIIIGFNQLMVEHYKKMKSALHIKDNSKAWKGISIVRTFLVITIGWVFDCSTSALHGIEQLGNMLNLSQAGATTHVGIVLVVLIALLVVVDILHELGICILDRIDRLPFVVQLILWTVFIQGIVILLGTRSGMGLMYAGF